MKNIIITVIALHVLSGVFWAGSTFTLARTESIGAKRLYWPQMSSAVVAIATGVWLWSTFHKNLFTTKEQVLALGAFAAIAAGGIQAAVVGRALRAISVDCQLDKGKQGKVATAHRIAAVLLLVTVLCMGASRYI